MPQTIFSLQGQVLKLTTTQDITPHILPLIDSHQFTQIIFSGNTIGVDAGKALASALSKQTNLSLVELSDMFTGRLKTEIPLILVDLIEAFKNKPIVFLTLSDNALGPIGAEPLVPFLSNNSVLTQLHLNNNGLGIFLHFIHHQ